MNFGSIIALFLIGMFWGYLFKMYLDTVKQKRYKKFKNYDPAKKHYIKY